MPAARRGHIDDARVDLARAAGTRKALVDNGIAVRRCDAQGRAVARRPHHPENLVGNAAVIIRGQRVAEYEADRVSLRRNDEWQRARWICRRGSVGDISVSYRADNTRPPVGRRIAAGRARTTAQHEQNDQSRQSTHGRIVRPCSANIQQIGRCSRMTTTWVLFLGAINSGNRNRMSMADLARELEIAGFRDVHTYMQSGNIIVEGMNRPIVRRRRPATC